jgi:hypothetical protein
VAGGNASADAALARVVQSGLADDPDAQYLAMDVDLLASDCRWAAGRAAEAIMFLHAAKKRYDDVVGGRLQEPGRLSPALIERLAEPLFTLYRDMADRLVVVGEVDLGFVTRRALIEQLHGLIGRLGDPARIQLTSALTDLARDLSESRRADEANAATAEAAAVEQPLERAHITGQYPHGARVGRGTQMVTWTPLPSTSSYAATTAAGAGSFNLTVLQAEMQRRTTAWLEAARPEARRLELEYMEQARVEAERREAERVESQRAAAAQLAAERAQAEQAERLDAERRAAAEEVERLERKHRREERIEAHRLEVERREAERREAERLKAERPSAEEVAADPNDAERLELERLQAEIDELERAEKRARDQ